MGTTARLMYLVKWAGLVACCFWIPACDLQQPARSSANQDSPVALGPRFRFTDVTEAAGIGFVHRHGGSGRHYYIETMGPGCAFFDYDADGWLDLFLVQGGPLPGYTPDRPLRHALYRNKGDGTFFDVTERSGLNVDHYGVGCCAADYDNDGDTDLFVTGLYENRLFDNNGDGTFSPAAAEGSPGGRSMCTTAGFVDCDHDGLLDLFVCRYMDYDLQSNPRCKGPLGHPSYCAPRVYSETTSVLFRNNGDGSFADVTETCGLAGTMARGMGLACADYNEDGWIDLYVSSDMSPNLLFFNTGEAGTFREDGVLGGAAYGVNGRALAGMGVDCGDADNDGHIDLVVTNFENEPISVFRNEGQGLFAESSMGSGVGAASLPFLEWGIRFVDLDLDGWQDLFVVAGHVDDYADDRDTTYGYAQPCQVYANDRHGQFTDVSADCGPFFTQRQVGRGAAFGDFDNDGDVDVAIACNNQPTKLLRNDTQTGANRLRLRLIGDDCNRDGLGARVQVTAGELTQTTFVRSGSSYLSDHDRRLVFGIGDETQAAVEVRWPCGKIQRVVGTPGELLYIRECECPNSGLKGEE